MPGKPHGSGYVPVLKEVPSMSGVTVHAVVRVLEDDAGPERAAAA